MLLRAAGTPPGFMVVPAGQDGFLDVVICTPAGLVQLPAEQGNGPPAKVTPRDGCPVAPIASGLPPAAPILPPLGPVGSADLPSPRTAVRAPAASHGWRARAPPAMDC